MPLIETENRVLILAPNQEDAGAMEAMLEGKGFQTRTCARVANLCREIPAGAGALILTEEALELSQINDFFEVLRVQPPWSELPLIVLTRGGESRVARLLDLASTAAGSVTVLERPIAAGTLL